MKILCLHGRRQSANTLLSKLFPEERIVHTSASLSVSTSSSPPSLNSPSSSVSCETTTLINNSDFLCVNLKSQMHKTYTFVAVNAPNEEEPALITNARRKTGEQSSPRCKLYSWWTGDRKTNCIGVEDSIKKLDEVMEMQKFDGILGFSQGGSFAHYYSQSRRRFRIAVFLSAYPFQCNLTSGKSVFPSPNETTSLHLYGENDQVIPPSKSLLLQQEMGGRIFTVANWGHAIPMNFNTIILPFLDTI